MSRPTGEHRGLLSRSYGPAVIAAAVVLLTGIFALHQNRILNEQTLRAEVAAKVDLVRSKLEGNINGNIQLVHGLAATVATEPDIDQKRFTQLAKGVIGKGGQLRHVAAAPDLVISMVHPREGNERVIGLDYRDIPEQREAALRARDTGELVLAGPVALKQGGTGLIGRFPIFVEEPTGKRFWGILSAVIDVERLYHDSGLRDDRSIAFALVGADALGEAGSHFYGSADILSHHPVTSDVVFPSGSWRIAAMPIRGWEAAPPNEALLCGIILLAGVLLVVPIGLAGHLHRERDLSFANLRRRETELGRLSQRLELALDASRIGVWEMDMETGHVIWDDRLYDIYGLSKGGSDSRHYQDWWNAVHPEDRARADSDFETAVAKIGRYTSNYRIIRPDGQLRHIRTDGMVTLEPGGTRRVIGAEWDITDDVLLNKDLEKAKVLAESRSDELEAARARIEYNALHDSLTGLPNRRYLDEKLFKVAHASRRDGLQVGLLHIDLDRFKQINDTLGHAAGDAMLLHVAQVLRANIRDRDFVARIGGDEFVVLCMLERGSTHLQEIADRIITEMRQPVPYKGHQCRFGVSIGIATEDGAAIDPGQLLVNADIALYRAKSRGRNRRELFNETLQAEIVRTKRIADDILGGLERNEFITYYQPQFDAQTLELAGVEALVRWNHPTEGILTPDAFLGTAEELNVVSVIDELVLHQALADFRGWNARGLGVPRISVNVSARRLRDEELIASLGRLDIERGVLSFELLESIFLDETDETVSSNVERIKELGIDIEIDDFGTGYASIVSLLKLQPRTLKIDRQLIRPLRESIKQRNLVKSLIDIGATLGIEVVAEGVESAEHARILKRLGCDKLQGYLFGRPQNAVDFEASVRERRWRKAS